MTKIEFERPRKKGTMATPDRLMIIMRAQAIIGGNAVIIKFYKSQMQVQVQLGDW